MQFFIRNLAGSVISLQVDATAMVASMMKRVWKEEQIPVDHQRWFISFENSTMSPCDLMGSANRDLMPNFDFDCMFYENEVEGELAAVDDSEFAVDDDEEKVDQV